MPIMTRETARALISANGIDVKTDFHALPSDQIERVLSAADSVNYRKPRNANGSRARYFHAYLCRRANSHESE